MKKPCKKVLDAARKRFLANKSLWLIPNDIICKQLFVSKRFLQRLRIVHGIPAPPRRDLSPQARVEALQAMLNIHTRSCKTIRPVRIHSVAGCEDLMILMHTWICKPMVSQ